jgi:hypothetical protein
MKSLALIFSLLLAGCASHGEPLPAPVPPQAIVSPPAYSANIVAYRFRYLTNSAPDFALKQNSVNWTRLPDTASAAKTNISIATVPAGSLIVATSVSAAGNESTNSNLVVWQPLQPPAVTVK